MSSQVVALSRTIRNTQPQSLLRAPAICPRRKSTAQSGRVTTITEQVFHKLENVAYSAMGIDAAIIKAIPTCAPAREENVRVLPITARMRSEGYSSRSVCLLNTVVIHKQLGHGNTLHLSCDIFSVLAEDVQYTECLQKVRKDVFILLILFYFSLAHDVYISLC